MTLNREKAPAGWSEDCESILRRFYSGTDLVAAMSELQAIVSQDGVWGQDVEDMKETLQVNETGKSKLTVVIERQIKSLVYQPHTMWRVRHRDQFPKLEEPALRVACMSTQSANVERCCKVHKITKTKARNRLGDKFVYMLCYCYVNLRLLNKLDPKAAQENNTDFEDFLAGAIAAEMEDDTTPSSL